MIGKIILIILGIIILLIAGTGYYFYKVYVFKTIRVCITNDKEDLKSPCSLDKECIDNVKSDMSSSGFSETKPINEVFIVFQDKVDEIYEKSISCAGTCRMKKIYGSENACKIGEEEIKIEINGEKALEIWKLNSK